MHNPTHTLKLMSRMWEGRGGEERGGGRGVYLRPEGSQNPAVSPLRSCTFPMWCWAVTLILSGWWYLPPAWPAILLLTLVRRQNILLDRDLTLSLWDPTKLARSWLLVRQWPVKCVISLAFLITWLHIPNVTPLTSKESKLWVEATSRSWCPEGSLYKRTITAPHTDLSSYLTF